MSTDSSGSGPQKKMTTAEILAKARAEKAAKAAAEAAVSADSPSADNVTAAEPVPVAEPSPVAPVAAPVAGAKPKSTADILAAARATAAAKAGAATAAPAAGGAAPKNTSDILAAARAAAAAKAAGAAVAPAAIGATAGAAPVSAKSAGSPTGPKPSVQEMLAAVRGGKESAAAVSAPVAAKAVAPPMPARPAAPVAKKAAAPETRRAFLSAAAAAVLSPFWVAWASFAAATLASTLAVLRFMLPNVLTEPPSKFKVGPSADYDLGTVSEKWKAQFGIWIVHTDKYQGKNLIYALSTVCTHLGCTPSWLDGEQKYKCPCHGSGFYINGVNFEGPAPRPLERVGIRLAEDGMLEVDKSLKFQEEMGQWNDPASYVEIS